MKKNFCDIWDNLFHLLVVNVFITVCAAAGLALCYAVGFIPGSEGMKGLYQLAMLFVFTAALGVLVFAEGDNAAKIAGFEGVKLSAYFRSIIPSLKDGAAFGLIVGLLAAVAFVSLPYYFRVWIPADGSEGSIVGLILLSLVFWVIVISMLSLQWFLPVRSLMHNSFLKCLKKSYIIFFDNPGFTIAVFLNNLLLLVISVLSIGMIPGVCGITLANTNALRLRLYKYDWIEVNPGLTKAQLKEVPWDELLETDRNTLGPRKFKSFLFPWKE